MQIAGDHSSVSLSRTTIFLYRRSSGEGLRRESLCLGGLLEEADACAV